MLLRSSPLAALTALTLLSGVAAAQVHYFPDQRPWRERAGSGPDAVVRGWYYNLGITGLRVELVEDAPTHLVVRHVFEGSPAARGIEVDDHIVGAAGERFAVPHENGYGMEVFGARGPIADFAAALDRTLVEGGGKLALMVLRDGQEREVTLRLDKRDRGLGETFPVDDPASAKKLAFLRDHLVELQRPDGSWGHEVHNLFAGLSLISSRDAKHQKAAERAARYHARTTAAEDEAGLVNWRYMTAGIVLAEYYLATKEKWVLPELQEVYAFLHSTQYVSLDQLKPSVKQSHPDSWPTTAAEQHGGWGHNPGFEGYGPIAMLTGEGAIAFALMERAGVEVDRERHAAAYAFLERGTGKNGYVWYADDVAGDQNWADMGRTGAAGVACRLARFDTETMRRRALLHATVIGEHPESFPDTHGSPILGMGFAAAAAWSEPSAFASLMRANRWWFVLSECSDGTFYYQPNRDNAGYGADSRLSATAAVAFILSIPERRLVMTGSEAKGAEKEGATK